MLAKLLNFNILKYLKNIDIVIIYSFIVSKSYINILYKILAN